MDWIIKALYAIRDWWNSDKLLSKAVRVPLRLAVVAVPAVIVLAAGLYTAGKVSAYLGDSKPATATQLDAFRSQMLLAVGECKPPAPKAPAAKKTVSKRK